jgi:hypothetical protein
MELDDVLNSSVTGKMYGRVRSKILCEEMGVTLSEIRNLDRATRNRSKQRLKIFAWDRSTTGIGSPQYINEINKRTIGYIHDTIPGKCELANTHPPSSETW